MADGIPRHSMIVGNLQLTFEVSTALGRVVSYHCRMIKSLNFKSELLLNAFFFLSTPS